MNPYIGVTGIGSAAEARACLAAWRDAWAGREPSHDLMLGVLASAKTLRNEPNRYPRRYPRRQDIAGCFVEEPGILNLIHLAMDLPDIWDPRVTRHALEAAGPRSRGIQINIPTPTDPRDHGGFCALLQGLRRERPRVVLQMRPQGSDAERIAADACFFAGRDPGPIPGASDVLIDGSGGRGRSLDLVEVIESNHEIRRRTRWLGYGPAFIGVAGGLCAETVPALAPLLRRYPDLSIDAEGRLRDDAEDGGNLDLEKVRAYLRAAVSLLQEGGLAT